MFEDQAALPLASAPGKARVVGRGATPPAEFVRVLQQRAAGRTWLLIHRVEEVLVGLRILHLVEQELHRIDGAHLHEDPA